MTKQKKEKAVVTTPTEAEQVAIVGGAQQEVVNRENDPHAPPGKFAKRGKRWIHPGDPPQGV